ncbi:adenosylcobinamide-GDP ribazoletransferase [Salinithrix halophila]|uniref:Adenosylcobinamide-GDP ribazoletransferase n=1 Tax=Salinithrix halophila TaxID=1485204 RepID=A0ABV8JFZ9_9BACL
MNAFFTALAFLTRIPVPVRMDPRDWPKSTVYYPLVGLVIGVLLVLMNEALSLLFPPLVRSVLVTAGWVFLTGGLHLDGLMDTADGLGANKDREQTLAIMKDSRVGAMGVLAAILLLGVKVSALTYLEPAIIPLLAAPVAARTGMTAAIAFFPYLREQGMGLNLREGLSPLRLGVALTSGTAIIAVVAGWWTFLILGGTALVIGLIARVVLRRLGGLTGDVYGCMAEAVEAAILLLWLAAGDPV